jgi:hypothetical protein
LHCIALPNVGFLAMSFVASSNFSCPFIAPPHVLCLAFFFSSFSSFSLLETDHCSLGYPDPIGTFRSLPSIIQPFGDTSYDRRRRRCHHARCGISMLNACRRCVLVQSRAVEAHQPLSSA